MRTLSLMALAAILSTGVTARQSSQNPLLDPAALHFTTPSGIQWIHDPVGADTAVIAGDPTGDGWYVMLVRWSPHHMSQPHWHEHDRFITVLAGTWWVGTGSRFAPDRTVPMPAGSVVTHFARHPHFDGAKDATCILEITGQGPDTAHPAATLPLALRPSTPAQRRPGVAGAPGAARAQAGRAALAAPGPAPINAQGPDTAHPAGSLPPLSSQANPDGSSPETLLAALNATISGPAGHRDWTRFRALWLPGARIQFARTGRDGKVTISALTPDDYIRQDDPYFAAHDFYETTLVKRNERFANIAQIWTSFALRRSPSGPAFARGVESCQFLFDGQRWWIANLLDQPESPAHPLPQDLIGH